MEELSDLIRQVIQLAESEAPLDQLESAVQTSGELSSLADELVSHFVEEARKSGASWSEVGARLGVTKQAAQQRFVLMSTQMPRLRRRSSRRRQSRNPFDRFSDRAKKAINLAQEEARQLEHNYLGTEHLLLGMLAEKGAAHKMLTESGVAIEQVRSEVERLIGRGTGFHDNPPFTPRSKKVIELAFREALRFGDNHVSSIHLLLGLLRESEGIGAQILIKLGISYDELRERAKDAPGDAAL